MLSTFILELGLRRLCLVPNLYILKHAINQETMPRHAKNYTWARPMPLDKFLKVYIPESSQTRPVVPKTYFDKIRSEMANDQEIYTPFVSLNNCSVISHGFTLLPCHWQIDLLHGDSTAGVPNLIPGLLAVDLSSQAPQSLRKFHTDVVFYKESVDISRDVDHGHSIELQLLSRKEAISDPYDAKENRPALRDLIRYASQAYSHSNRRLVSFFIFVSDPWILDSYAGISRA